MKLRMVVSVKKVMLGIFGISLIRLRMVVVMVSV